MKRMIIVAAATFTAAAWAVPPGPIDGLDIPSDFGAGNRLALQTNVALWGKSFHRFRDEGSELDQLWVLHDWNDLYIGVTGNLATNGNQIMIFIEDPYFEGQNGLKSGVCEGPPFALQDLGEAYLNTNGTPEDSNDDFYERFADGAAMDATFSPTHVITVDVYEATVHVSAYNLNDDSTPVVTFYDHPDTLMIEELDSFTSRCYLGEHAVNDGAGVLYGWGWEFPSGVGCLTYTPEAWEVGLDDRNVDGVTGSDASGAATATLGLEIKASLFDLFLDGTETIKVMALLTGPGNGYVSNQSLPPMDPNAQTFGPRFPQIDLENGFGYSGLQHAVVNLAGVSTGSPPAIDGDLTDGAYNASTLVATQTLPTSYGDQTDADQFDLIVGNELDALYVTHDVSNLYVGITGSLAAGNHVALFVDGDPLTGERLLNSNGCWDIFSGGGCFGMNGNSLPLLPDDSVVNYDAAVSLHLSDGLQNRQVIRYDLVNDQAQYVGYGPANTGGSLSGGSNANGMEFAYNWAQVDPADGVPDCGDYAPECFFLTPAEVEASAGTMETGFEAKLPFADIGVDLSGGSAVIHLWALIVNHDGDAVSEQALPSLRNQKTDMIVPPGMDESVDFTRPTYPDSYLAYDARAATYTVTLLPADGDFDADGNVDLADFGSFQLCFGQTNLRSENQQCLPGDFVADNGITLSDLPGFVSHLTGP